METVILEEAVGAPSARELESGISENVVKLLAG